MEASNPTTKRRKRPSLACDNCKRRKIKCDRGSPCAQCLKSKIVVGCNYEVLSKDSKVNMNDRANLPVYVTSAKTPLHMNAKKQKIAKPEQSIGFANYNPNGVSTNQVNQVSFGTQNHNISGKNNGKFHTSSIRKTSTDSFLSKSSSGSVSDSGSAPGPTAQPSNTIVSNGTQNEMVMISKSAFEALSERLSNIENSIQSRSKVLVEPRSFQNGTAKQPLRSSTESPETDHLGILKPSTRQESTNLEKSTGSPSFLNRETYSSRTLPNFTSKSQHSTLTLPSLNTPTGSSPFSFNGTTYSNHISLNTGPKPTAPNSYWSSQLDPKLHLSIQNQSQNQIPGNPQTYAKLAGNLPTLRNNSYSSNYYSQNTTNNSASPSFPSSLDTYSSTTSNTKNGISSSIVNPIQLPPIRMLQKPEGKEDFYDYCTMTELCDVIGKNPYLSEQDTINLFEESAYLFRKGIDRRINFGPFAWSSLIKRDAALSTLWDHLSDLKDSEKDKAFQFPNSDAPLLSPENAKLLATSFTNDGINNIPEMSFQKKELQFNGVDDIVPYENLKSIKENKRATNINQNTLPLGLTYFEGKINSELFLIDKIKILLPKKKVIWKLMKRFFTWLYPFMPLLDEECFTLNISSIIGECSYEDVNIEELKVVRRLDLAYLGILLIMLRLLYLSLFVNKASTNEARLNSTATDPESQEIKYLLSNPINIDLIDLASCCLDQFKLFRRNSLAVLQLCVFLRIYHSFSPEDGDGVDGGDSLFLNTMMLQMAYSMGLNRDPSKLDLRDSPRQSNINRKIWWFLYACSVHQSYSFGEPLLISKANFDVKQPFYEEENSNIPDHEMDKEVCELNSHCFKFMEPIVEILELLLDVNGNPKVSEICRLITIIENEQYMNNGTLKDCLEVPLGSNKYTMVYRRNIQIKYYFSVNGFLITLFFHLYLYYMKKEVVLSFFYLKKMLLIITQNFMPYYFELLDGSEYMLDFIMNPTIQQLIHKSNIILLGLGARLNYIIYTRCKQPNHQELMKNDERYRNAFEGMGRVSFLLKRCTEISIAAISKISNRYYYAWKIAKSQTYMLQTVNNTTFYEKNKEKFSLIDTDTYPPEYIQYLIGVLEKTVIKFANVEQLAPQLCGMCTVNSYVSSEPVKEDLSYLHSKDVDLFWFQMLSMKYDKPTTSNTFTEDGQPPGTHNSGQMSDFDYKFGLDMEQMTRFDLFNELPFEMVFK